MTTISATRPMTVSDYAGRIGRAIRQLGGAVVEGEVQKAHRARSGLLYFDLTDGEAKLCCKVFGRQAARLEHTPVEGDLVQVVVERPDFWRKVGKLDLIVAEVSLAGEGELLRRRTELLERLRAEGLCDPARRKPLPRFPRAVGLIAGKGSDGRSDVIRALQDRFPPVHVVACDALVQGKAAPRDVIDALACLQEHPVVDAIVVARGGGSTQDLVAFDDERLCRAMFACAVPVVAAIGHTDNSPVCNEVAYAAYTPSRSAELVVPSAAELGKDLCLARHALGQVPARMGRQLEQLEVTRERLDVSELTVNREREVADRSQRIRSAEDRFFSARESALGEARAAVNTVALRAEADLSEREREYKGARERLATAADRVEARNSEIAEHGRRLRVGLARQLADHERDYSHALARLISQTKDAVLRRLVVDGDRLGRLDELVRERVERRVADVSRELSHLAALVEARDFRRRGFLLAADEAGRPLSSVSGLREGTCLSLWFRDGRAKAVVNEIEEESG